MSSNKPSARKQAVSNAETGRRHRSDEEKLKIVQESFEEGCVQAQLARRHGISSNRGAAKNGQGDHTGAVDDYDEAIRLDPSLAAAWYNRAIAKAEQGDHAGAVLDYSEALRLDPGHAGIWYNRGNAKNAQGDHAGAVDDCDEATRLDPTLAGGKS